MLEIVQSIFLAMVFLPIIVILWRRFLVTEEPFVESAPIPKPIITDSDVAIRRDYHKRMGESLFNHSGFNREHLMESDKELKKKYGIEKWMIMLDRSAT
jgi:hypothetical protein